MFLIGSFAAVRSRRHAGLLFLISGPLATFCLSFEDSYVGVPFRGYNWNRPSLLTAALFVCAFFAPLYAPLMATRNRKRAVFVFLVLALLSGLLFLASPWTMVILPRLVEFSAVFLVFGAFWLVTDQLGWPPLTGTRLRPFPGRATTVSIGCVLVTVLVIFGTFVVSARDSQPWDPDCGERQLFAQPLNSAHAVFTARAIRVGHVAKISGRWAGNWAVGLVQERFWGLPWWSPRLVFLTTHAFAEGDIYLIDGTRDQRLLNRFLPIVEAGPCTRTGPVGDRTVEQRLLRESPSPNEFRIVGRVVHPTQLRMETQPGVNERMSFAEIEAVQERRRYLGVNYRRPETPLPGAKIRVTGSFGSMIVTADRDGVFEVAGLPPNECKLELIDVPNTQRAVNRTVQRKELLEKKLVRADLYLF